jgi:hypothetical protein
MAQSNNIVDNTNFEGKVTNPRTITALSSTSTVNIDFTAPKLHTLTITQNTIFNVTGTYKQGDYVELIVTGNFTVSFIQSTFTFRGVFISSGVLTNYVGTASNSIVIRCTDSTNKIFEVISNPLYT